MRILSDQDWHELEEKNRSLGARWIDLQRARQRGNTKEILKAEMQYLSALQNLNSIVEIAVNPARRKPT